MRPNNPNKRLRGRNRSKNANPLARSYESNGPDVKIRGSALQVADKYTQLARDAQSAGDRVMAENYFQHAEHYYRIVAQAYEQAGHQQPRERRDDERGRFDERYRGEQPMLNGYDGVDEDEDFARRPARTGAARQGENRGEGDTDGEGAARPDEDDAHAAAGHGNGVNGHEVVLPADPAAASDAGPATGQGEAAPESGATTEAAADSTADAAAAGDDTDAPAKPKRRARTPRTRTRTRRSDADGTAAAPSEATEPTS